MLHHLDRALENAVNDGEPTAAVKLQVDKAGFLDDETLLVSALAEAAALGDVTALASAEQRYGTISGSMASSRNRWLMLLDQSS
jgi:hypothetical protein